MYKYVAKCCVVLPKSTRVIEKVGLRLAELCKSTIDQGGEKTFVFAGGEAIAKAVDDGLLIQVAAMDLVSSHAIRIALEATVYEVVQVAPKQIAWHPTGGTPVSIPKERLADAERTLADRAD